MSYSESSVLVTGHATPVKEDAISAVYQVLCLSLIIDTNTDIIEKASCTMVMKDSESFISALLVGRNILTDMKQMRDLIVSRFFSIAQKPLTVALKDVQNRYLIAFPQKRTSN